MMKMTPTYKNRIISLPAEAVREKLSTATKEELAVLIAVCDDPEAGTNVLTDRLGLTEKVFGDALAMWQAAGAIALDDEPAAEAVQKPEETEKKPDKPKSKGERRVTVHTTLPYYSQEEVAEIVEHRDDCSELLDSCQQTLGKMFNMTETAGIIRLIDHLALPGEYILMLCQYAADIGKPSVRMVEKLAIEYYDRDVLTCEALEEELNGAAERKTLESYVRSLFGLGGRSLIKKEKDFIAAWSNKYHFSRELIRAAYEETVSKINKPSMDYTNKVLENWYSVGCKTPEDVAAAAQQHAAGAQPGSSFKTDEFFEAALKRSYASAEQSENDDKKGDKT